MNDFKGWQLFWHRGAPSNDVDLLQYYRDENKTYLFFKKCIFGIILFCAISFLAIGLSQAFTAVTHLITTQKNTIALISGELKKEECEKTPGVTCEYELIIKKDLPISAAESSKNKKNEPNNTKVETKVSNNETVITTIKSDSKPDKPKKKDSNIVSQIVEQVWVLTGSIITLIVVVLAVGLTLLLTITKHVFSPRRDKYDDNTQGTFVCLTTPIGSVIESILEAIKKKFQ